MSLYPKSGLLSFDFSVEDAPMLSGVENEKTTGYPFYASAFISRIG